MHDIDSLTMSLHQDPTVCRETASGKEQTTGDLDGDSPRAGVRYAVLMTPQLLQVIAAVKAVQVKWQTLGASELCHRKGEGR